MSHPNSNDAALYWGLIGVGVGPNPTDRDATDTGARGQLADLISQAIFDPGAALERHRGVGENLVDYQAAAVLAVIELLAATKARSFTPQQAPKVDVMNLAAEYVQFVPASLVTTDLEGATQTRREYYEPSLMRAAFRHGWDAYAGDPAPEPVQIYRCSGCGRLTSDVAADLAAIKAEDQLSCCPERNMVLVPADEIIGIMQDRRRLQREAGAAAVRTTTDALSASVPTPEEIEAALLQAQMAPRTCRLCGCTDTKACVDDDLGPCWWVEKDLCSHCQPSNQMRHLKKAFAAGVHPMTEADHREEGEFGEGATVRPRVSQATADAMMAVVEAAGQLEAKQLSKARHLVLTLLAWFDIAPPAESMLDGAAHTVRRLIPYLTE